MMNVRICLGVVCCLLLLSTVTLHAEEAVQKSASSPQSPQSVKPAGVNVQNGTVQFGPQQSGTVQFAPPGGQMSPFGMPGMGPMAVPPTAPPRMLRVRVVLYSSEKLSSLPEWSVGPAEQMLEKVADGFKTIDSFDLTMVTGHETKVQHGSQESVVSGSQFVPQRGFDGRPSSSRTNQYRVQNFGTMLAVSPEMVGKRAILNLTFERSGLVQPDEAKNDDEKEGVETGDDIQETGIVSDQPPSTSTMMIDTQVLLASGQATLLKIRDSRGVQHAMVIAVEVLDSGEAEAAEESELMKAGGFF